MEIDSKVSDAARSVARHLGEVADTFGKRHEAYRALQNTRGALYKIAQAKWMNESDLQDAATQILSYLKQYGDTADPQVMAFRDVNESLLKAFAEGGPGVTPPEKPARSKPAKASR